ncbi:hypothetical protein ACHAWF_017613 [Thalassiosira exigua]
MAAQSNAAATFCCALSGLSPLLDPVATPSGYVCSRSLLLKKLAENGGVDPFDSSDAGGGGGRRLDESDLVDLNVNGASVEAPPRPPKSSSLPNLLTAMRDEFDAVLLELYDSRKALEETRRELSAALYQNDAAVRVVARVCRERDEARGKLEEFLRGDATAREAMAAEKAGADGGAAEGAAAEKRGRDEGEGGVEADAPLKKAKTDEPSPDDGPADRSKIPPGELDAMSKTWKSLSKGRKAISKLKRTDEETKANEASLGKLAEGAEKKVNLGKSSAKAGVLCVASIKGKEDAEYLIAGGHHKSAVVYDVASGKITATLTGAGGDVTSVHGMAFDDRLLVVAGSADGCARLHSVPLAKDDESSSLGVAELGAKPVDVAIHPSSTASEARIVVATAKGTIELYKWSQDGEGLTLLARLESPSEGTEYASGKLHPDGLIYVAGTTDGKLLVWDLKTQAVAGTLEVSQLPGIFWGARGGSADLGGGGEEAHGARTLRCASGASLAPSRLKFELERPKFTSGQSGFAASHKLVLTSTCDFGIGPREEGRRERGSRSRLRSSIVEAAVRPRFRCVLCTSCVRPPGCQLTTPQQCYGSHIVHELASVCAHDALVARLADPSPRPPSPFLSAIYARPLQGHDGNPVECVATSDNGYHIASSSSDAVSVWDLRKLKLAATIDSADVSGGGAATSLAFDPSATYLAYSGEGGTKVCVAKDWERVVCHLVPSKGSGKRGKKKGPAGAGGVAWGGAGFGKGGEEEGSEVWIAAGCDGERPVRFWGVE